MMMDSKICWSRRRIRRWVGFVVSWVFICENDRLRVDYYFCDFEE